MWIIQACELSEPILRYILMNGRVVSRASMRIKQGVRISEGQIIQAIRVHSQWAFAFALVISVKFSDSSFHSQWAINISVSDPY